MNSTLLFMLWGRAIKELSFAAGSKTKSKVQVDLWLQKQVRKQKFKVSVQFIHHHISFENVPQQKNTEPKAKKMSLLKKDLKKTLQRAL